MRVAKFWTSAKSFLYRTAQSISGFTLAAASRQISTTRRRTMRTIRSVAFSRQYLIKQASSIVRRGSLISADSTGDDGSSDGHSDARGRPAGRRDNDARPTNTENRFSPASLKAGCNSISGPKGPQDFLLGHKVR